MRLGWQAPVFGLCGGYHGDDAVEPRDDTSRRNVRSLRRREDHLARRLRPLRLRDGRGDAGHHSRSKRRKAKSLASRIRRRASGGASWSSRSKPAPGNPWSWQGCYWDHEPQAEVELLRRGFHIAFISANATLKPGKQWDAWYAFLTEKHGLSKKPAFVGMSRGGEYAYTWATANPDKVSCIYADNPGVNRGAAREARRAGQATTCRCCTSAAASIRSWASTSTGHREHLSAVRRPDLRDDQGRRRPSSAQPARPQADRRFHRAERSAGRQRSARLRRRHVHEDPHSTASRTPTATSRRKRLTSPAAGRGSRECYDRYAFRTRPASREPITVIVPKTAAPGKPWVFRADFVDRDAAVDLALLAKGFHIVTGPVPYNADGPIAGAVERRLQAPDRPRLFQEAGDGRRRRARRAKPTPGPSRTRTRSPASTARIPSCAASCRRRRRSTTSRRWPKPACRSCTSAAASTRGSTTQTRVVEKRYKELGGQITVIVKEGEGHYPLAPKDPKPVVDFIVGKVR